MIRSDNQLSVAPALTVDRFLTVAQRALKLEPNLAFTTTNGDLCVILSVVFSFAQGERKWRQYKCCDTILSLVLAI